MIWFNEICDEDIDLAESYGYEYYGSERNLGIAGGYQELVARATGSLFLFLENDWQLIASPFNQIREGALLLDSRSVDVVRYRHRQHPGDPLWSRQFAGKETTRPEYLLESMHWEENPEKFVIPGHDNYQYHPITKLSFGWYTTDSRYASWTNNPTMFRTDWIQNLARNRFYGDVEISINEWWRKTLFRVAQGDGLFQHWRIG